MIHLATAAVVNAVWDLVAKRAGKPLWKLLVDMTPEQIVGLVDFRYMTDALTPDEALERSCVRSPSPAARAREAELRRDGYPAYTTSVGWLGYDDDKIRRLCREALADGWTRFKMKVGADVDDDVRRARDHPRGDRTGAGCWRSTPTSAGTSARRSTWMAAPGASSTRTGSRSRRARTTSSATRRSPGPSRRSGSRPASTSTTG